jgi:protein SCO1/2
MATNRRLFIQTLLLACALLLGACGSHTFSGTVIEPPNDATDFTLTAHTGQPFRLSEQRGKVVLLFFGFTHCPDVCPTALSDMAAVFRKLGPDAERVQVAFITVDPERDTPQRMEKYMKIFNPTFLGLSGTRAEIDPIIKAYGATARRRDLPNSALVYTMDHSAFTYVIDQSGKWVELFGSNVDIDAMADDIRYLVRKGAS